MEAKQIKTWLLTVFLILPVSSMAQDQGLDNESIRDPFSKALFLERVALERVAASPDLGPITDAVLDSMRGFKASLTESDSSTAVANLLREMRERDVDVYEYLQHTTDDDALLSTDLYPVLSQHAPRVEWESSCPGQRRSEPFETLAPDSRSGFTVLDRCDGNQSVECTIQFARDAKRGVPELRHRCDVRSFGATEQVRHLFSVTTRYRENLGSETVNPLLVQGLPDYAMLVDRLVDIAGRSYTGTRPSLREPAFTEQAVDERRQKQRAFLGN